MKINSVKGTNDYLPNDLELRDYLQSRILATYKECGFERISTPIMEDIENLDKSDGGENLSLLFKILKRGDKLEEALASGNASELCDMGLRYDLTLPLSRYYAANRASLNTPFKCIQVDRVFRAERPQKGRLREFIQCDIDILGSSSINCEIELIRTTAKALLAVDIKNFKIKVNDRRLLKALLCSAGFDMENADSVCISFDKLSEIGMEGVKAELTEKGFAQSAIDNFEKMFSITPFTLEDAKKYCSDPSVIEDLSTIINVSNELAGDDYTVEYDRSLVRGQGYYTGTIFEIESLDFGSSIAGGGRYDNMIGKFIGENVPAVGFSIGFERIASILSVKGYKNPVASKKLALIYPEKDITAAIAKAEEFRGEGYSVTLFEFPKKLGKLLGKLEQQGFYGCFILGEADQIKVFEQKASIID